MGASHNMDSLQFTLPVRIQREDAAAIDEIYCVSQAISVLEEWQAGPHDELRRGVLKYCRAAIAGQVSADDAQKALMLLARKTGVLARDMKGVVVVDNYGELVPLTH